MSLGRNSVHQMLQDDVDSTANYALSEKIDCFSTLPLDIFIKIFKHLSLPSLLRCGAVSRFWNEIALDSTFYNNISEQFECEKQIAFLKMLIKRSNRVEKFEYKFYNDDLVSVNCSSIDKNRVCSSCTKPKLANLYKVLNSFFQRCCQELTHLKFDSDISLSLLSHLGFEDCCLQRNNLFGSIRLKSIDLSNQLIDEINLIHLLNRNPDLECLKLDECYGVISLDLILTTIRKSNKKMKRVEFHPVGYRKPHTQEIFLKCDKLEELSMEMFLHKENETSVDKVSLGCINLKKLRLDCKKFPNYDDISPLLCGLKNLTHLTVTYKPAFNQVCPKPPTRRSSNKSIEFCKKVFENLPKLEKLGLSAYLIIPTDIKKLEEWYSKLCIAM